MSDHYNLFSWTTCFSGLLQISFSCTVSIVPLYEFLAYLRPYRSSLFFLPMKLLRFSLQVKNNMVQVNLCLSFAAILSTFVAQFPTVAIKPGVVNGAKCPTTAVNSFSSIPYVQLPSWRLTFRSSPSFPRRLFWRKSECHHPRSQLRSV